MSSNSFNTIGSGGIVNYDEVKETIGDQSEGGWTIHQFQFFGNTVGEVDASWRRGLPKQVKTYNSAGTLQSGIFYRMTNTMDGQFTGRTAAHAGTHPCAEAGNRDTDFDQFPSRFSQLIYDFPIDWIHMDTVIKNDYTTGMTSISATHYDNPQHKLATRSTTFNSDGTKVTNFTKYPTDFSFSGIANSDEAQALKLLQDKHIHNVPIEQYSQKWAPGGGAPLTIGGRFTEFRTAGTGDDIVLMAGQHGLELPVGISDFQPSYVSGNVVSKDSRYVLKGTVREYDKRTNLVALYSDGGRSKSYVWGYNQTLPIAVLDNNSQNRNMAFTSFESDAPGNWTFNTSSVTTSEKLTGKRCLDLTQGSASVDFASSAALVYGVFNPTLQGKYIVSYWRKSGSVTVNGTSPSLIGASSNGWTYCEHVLINPPNVSVNGNTKIDELRFYPAVSIMKSYTYEPLTGVTSADSGNGIIVFYEYDAMGRLTIERDVFGKILKQYTYQFQATE
ncbi:MAG: hypothetical protein EOO94_02675 [Pedobacter sp.]|nr:MAG: hypothetical protein EOO94_02675 [Pedobacter sp.]